MKSITGIKRGCGKRVVGGLYICCGLSPFGKPIEYFIIDPPEYVEYKNFRSPIFIGDDLLIWVGSEYYPYPSDFIEEAKAFGVSKRIPVNFPVERITTISKMYFVHSKSIVENYRELPAPFYCPKNYQHHLKQEECCIGYSYSLSSVSDGNTRKIGDTEYTIYPFKENVKPQYRQGIFLALPVTHFDFIVGKNPDRKLLEKVKSIAEKTEVPLNIEEE
ncbi:MAG: hypothetical protein NC899_09130 [Candidatus Omnitrophica bacterium]|nr:hypothetical protein [Candidatus Omnitrophota bacterium]